jgi:hypothetical protein
MPINTVPPANGERSGNLGRGRRLRFIRQRVNIVDNSLQAPLAFQLPPQCRVVWTAVRNQTAVALKGTDATSTANAYGLFNMGTSTAFGTATVSNATASALITVASGTTALAAGAAVRNTGGLAAAQALNTATTPVNLALLPMVVASNRLYPKTDGFLFDGAAQVDVTVYYEEFSDTGA